MVIFTWSHSNNLSSRVVFVLLSRRWMRNREMAKMQVCVLGIMKGRGTDETVAQTFACWTGGKAGMWEKSERLIRCALKIWEEMKQVIGIKRRRWQKAILYRWSSLDLTYGAARKWQSTVSVWSPIGSWWYGNDSVLSSEVKFWREEGTLDSRENT